LKIKRADIMASISRDPNGRKRVLFVAGDGSRKTIRLGKMTMQQAKTFKLNLEILLSAKFTFADIDKDWVDSLPDGLYNKLVKAGLLDARKPAEPEPETKRITVEAFAGQYITSRPDVKEATRRKWQDVKDKLAIFFKDTFIDDVTIQQAKSFRINLKSIGLSENTIRRHIGISRQFFNSAIESEIISKNPFCGQSVSNRANPERFYYITQEMALKVLAACPDAQWRLIFGLARWGGLRCPSEVLRIKWQDVDFEHSRFIVHASKTEHHEGGGIRTVPMFPELRKLFQDCFDEAPEGAVYCIDRYKGKWTNLGVQMARIIRQAGIEPWPKIFQNMRSTRETELFKLTGGNVKAVCSWIGNSPVVAMQHYAQVTSEAEREAVKTTLLNETEKAAQNTAQYVVVSDRMVKETTQSDIHEIPVFPDNTAPFDAVQEETLGGTRLELVTSCVSSTRSSQLS
jgi:integrase